MFDYHMHSNYSCDANMSLEEIALKSIELGLKEIAITEHVDLLYPPVSYPIWDVDFEKYVVEFFDIKEKYKNKLSIIFGVEAGLQPHSIAKTQELLNKYPFEFIIASTHVVEFKDLYDNNAFYIGKTKDEAYRIYFEDVLNSIKNFDNFNVYGHLDIVRRYGNYPDNMLDYSKHGDIIDEILKLLIHKGKGIEVNTSGFRYGLFSFHPHVDILKRYKELGGEILTVGSDAHNVTHIAYMFDKTFEIIKDLGFKYLTTFKEKEPHWIKL